MVAGPEAVIAVVQELLARIAEQEREVALLKTQIAAQERVIATLEQEGQPWAGEMKELLVAIKARVAQEQASGGERLDEMTRQEFEARYQRILMEGLAANPPPQEPRPPGKRGRRKQSKAKNLLDRLGAHQQSVLAFTGGFPSAL